MPVKGQAAHSARLKRLSSPQASQAIARALYAAGQLIEIEAEISITQGSISGAGHVPSRPGEPPNADTRRLDTSIETTLESTEPPRVHVTANDPKAAFLEFGTSRMEARPFMRPAAEKKRAEASALVRREVNKLMR